MGGKRNCEKIDKGLYKRYSKMANRYSLLYKFAVAPRAGAWIEIDGLMEGGGGGTGRTSCRCVD